MIRTLVIAAIVALLAAACGGSADSPTPTIGAPAGQFITATSAPTGTPSPTETPQPTPTPLALGGVRIQELVEAAPVVIDGFALYIETGCYYCDGPATGIVRLYRDPLGNLRQDTIVEDPLGEDDYIAAMLHSADMQDIVVSICSTGYCGGIGDIAEDAASTILRSRDGGVTWDNLGEYRGRLDPIELAADDLLVTRMERFDERASEPYWLNAGITVPAGPQPQRAFATAQGPVTRSPDERAFIDAEGDPFFSLEGLGGPRDENPSGRVSGTIVFPDDDRTLVTGWFRGNDDERISLFAIVRQGRVEAAWQSVNASGILSLWLSASSTLGLLPIEGQISLQPVVVDLDSGSYSPIEGPFGPDPGIDGRDPLIGRNLPIAILPGPFARIVDGDTCIVSALTDTPKPKRLGCYAEGVLLRTFGETTMYAGQEWVYVQTPGGTWGYAAAVSLEYTPHDGLAFHPVGTLTGLPTLDAIIAAAVADDIDALAALVAYEAIPCGPDPPATGGVHPFPHCLEGEAEGTLVNVARTSCVEGGATRRARVEELLTWYEDLDLRVYSITRESGYSGEYFSAPNHYDLLLTPAAGGNVRTMSVSSDGIIGLELGCSGPAASVVSPTDDFLLEPPGGPQ